MYFSRYSLLIFSTFSTVLELLFVLLVFCSLGSSFFVSSWFDLSLILCLLFFSLLATSFFVFYSLLLFFYNRSLILSTIMLISFAAFVRVLLMPLSCFNITPYHLDHLFFSHNKIYSDKNIRTCFNNESNQLGTVDEFNVCCSTYQCVD